MKTKPLIAEFIGTFALIFVGISAIASNYMIGGGKTTDIVAIALAHGLTIATMITATATTSGGHLNPAVTLGVWLTGRMNILSASRYVLFQCLGAMFAASLVKLAFPAEILRSIGMGTPTLGKGISPVMGFVMEFVLTFFLVLTVFTTAINPRAPKVGGLFIGLTVALDILAGGSISGAAMNPARYLGPALVGGGLHYFWLYWIAPLAGGATAALFYYYIFEERSAF